jgi:hypothetical protein
MSIVMCVSKKEDGNMFMGEFVQNIMGEKTNALKNVVKIAIVQHPQGQGFVPIVMYYPNMFVKEFINNKKLDELTIPISDEYLIFEEEDIIDGMIQIYKKEMARRTGIEIVQTMPNNVKPIRTIN